MVATTHIYIPVLKSFLVIEILLVNIALCNPGLLEGALDIPAKLTGESDKDSDNPPLKIPTVEIVKNLTTAPPPLVVRLKKTNVEEISEPECEESMFMSPFHYPVTFYGNYSISERMDATCKWNFIGTEPCIPLLSCPDFDLKEPNDSGKCVEEYFEVTDGYKGIKRYCGDKGPINISASDNTRDLYITFKTKNDEDDDRDKIFKCTVICSGRGEGTSLPKTIQRKENPKCLCGNKPNDDRIIGGDNATKGEFPWLVALVEAKTRQPFCGGSIINDRIILTAGHCFKAKFLDVKNFEILLHAHILDISPNPAVNKIRPPSLMYNSSELKALDAGNGTFRFQVEEIMVHPLYVSETNDYDVAVLRLSKPINFAKLKTAMVAGWGLPGSLAPGTPSRLQKLKVNVFSPKECKDFYAHRVNRRMMCAGYPTGEMDACSGDSGGPLVLEDRTKVWYQIASVSWGESCALLGNPGVYFRTTESGQWINHHSNANDAVWCAVP